MSRFYGSLEGRAKTIATRQGTPQSGIRSHTRGWDAGVEVIGRVDEKGKDVFEVYATGGSNRPSHRLLIGKVVEYNGGFYYVPADYY